MFKEVLQIGLKIVMQNHTYKFDNCIRHKHKGGPMKLELTGNIAQISMIWWDRTFKACLHEIGPVSAIYKRYIGDINLATIGKPLGTRYVTVI